MRLAAARDLHSLKREMGTGDVNGGGNGDGRTEEEKNGVWEGIARWA